MKGPNKPVVQDLAAQEGRLYETARWVEIKIPIRGSTKCLTLATVYGISGASGDAKKKAQNEALLCPIIARAIEADGPYILTGDINIEPEESPAVAAAIEAGALVDVGHTWATQVDQEEDDEQREKIPDRTYCNEGPTPGMTGPGTSRIDVMLANCVAAAAITDFLPRWDLTQEKHVPLQLELSLEGLQAEEAEHVTKGNVKPPGDMEGRGGDAEDFYEKAKNTYMASNERCRCKVLSRQGAQSLVCDGGGLRVTRSWPNR